MKMKLVSMRLPKKTKKEMEKQGCCSPMGMGEDKYPWGLSINLNNESLKMLGMDPPKDLSIGDTMTIMAKVVVTSVSMRQVQSGDDDNSVGLQITDISLGDSDAYDKAWSEKDGDEDD